MELQQGPPPKIYYGFEKLFSLLFAIAGNLFLAGIFFSALLFPESHAEFIFRTGLMIFVVEFMSIHSSGMFASNKIEITIGSRTYLSGHWFWKFFMILIYSLFVGVFGFLTSNYFLPLMYVVSLASKVFVKRAAVRPLPVFVSVPLLLFSVAFVGITADWWTSLFPFPQEVLSQKRPGSSGLFIDQPQTLLVWGIVYYFLLAGIELLLFWWGPRLAEFEEKSGTARGIIFKPLSQGSKFFKIISFRSGGKDHSHE